MEHYFPFGNAVTTATIFVTFAFSIGYSINLALLITLSLPVCCLICYLYRLR